MEIKSTESKSERIESEKFFTNSAGNSLLKKFNDIFDNPPEIKVFHCVSGYFSGNGYHRLREKLSNLSEVKILVGIGTVGKIARHYAEKKQKLTPSLLKQDLNNEVEKIMVGDVNTGDYNAKAEQSVFGYRDDSRDKKIEIHIHNSKKLHAKIYIFLPKGYHKDKDAYKRLSGSVITGSSNFTDSGLGANDEQHKNNHEFNVLLTEPDEVMFAEEEFQELWADSCELLPETIEKAIAQTYLKDNGKGIEPYHLFLKFLYEYFKERIDYDADSIGDLPHGVIKLRYQMDAVNEAYKMLMDFDGCFLADVVGFGKTYVAALIANKLAIENGKDKTRILVVYPLAVEEDWKDVFTAFRLDGITKFISRDSLHKILDKDKDYYAKEKYSIIIVDESHGFRNNNNNRYGYLQQITKSPITDCGKIITRKKVILLSATPFNNSPEELLNQILLFTDEHNSSLPIKNLGNYFKTKNKTYDGLKNNQDDDELKKLMGDIRRDIIQPITVRRVRKDLKNHKMYQEDLIKQEINFPEFDHPQTFEYQMDAELITLFNDTVNAICDELNYTRYRMITVLTDQVLAKYYRNINLNSTAGNLATLMKTRMIKSLESSFTAFKSTLGRLQSATTGMLEMIDRGTVYFVSNSKLQDWLDNELTYEEMEESTDDDKKFSVKNDFDSGRLADAKTQLENDKEILDALLKRWQKIDRDPKLEKFLAELPAIIKPPKNSKHQNSEGKLVIFSESKVTTQYLSDELEKLPEYKGKILNICADNRKNLFETIRENFDANYKKEQQKNDFSILISTEVLAEGVNLHRANCVLNYDIPWNSIKLIQRIGRVNRIGSKADKIFTYAFYPSEQGDAKIDLKKITHLKLQSSHYMYGSDSQVLSSKEVLIDVVLHSPQSETEDGRLKYLQIIRDLRNDEKRKPLFDEIVRLSIRSRSVRKREHHDISTAVFLRANEKCEFFVCKKDKEEISSVDFVEFAKILECEPTTPLIPQLPDFHYDDVNRATTEFEKVEVKQAQQNNAEIVDEQIQRLVIALGSKRNIDNKNDVDKIIALLKKGTYSKLPKEATKAVGSKIDFNGEIRKLAKKYNAPETPTDETKVISEIVKPQIILSESFV